MGPNCHFKPNSIASGLIYVYRLTLHILRSWRQQELLSCSQGLPSTWHTAGRTERKNETRTQPLVKGKNCIPQTSPAEKRTEGSGESVLMSILPNNSKNLAHCCLGHSCNDGSVLHLPVRSVQNTVAAGRQRTAESWGCKVLLSHSFSPLKVWVLTEASTSRMKGKAHSALKHIER